MQVFNCNARMATSRACTPAVAYWPPSAVMVSGGTVRTALMSCIARARSLLLQVMCPNDAHSLLPLRCPEDVPSLIHVRQVQQCLCGTFCFLYICVLCFQFRST